MSYILNTLLTDSAAKYPSSIALEDVHGQNITYVDLNKKINYHVQFLLKHNLGKGCRIGILLDKSIDSVACIFSVLRIKAAYVPLDVHSPISRINTIIEDCDLHAMFVATALLSGIQKDIKKTHAYKSVKINEIITLLVFAKKQHQTHKQPLAYLLYTSGSTGIPKGVMHSHESAFAFINWSMKTFKSKHTDKFISHAPFHFDLSIFDLFVSISVGATLVLLDDNSSSNPLLLASTLHSKQISVFYTTPSTLIYLLKYGKMNKYNFQYLNKILFAGEVFPIESLKQLKTVLPDVELYNLYGPTETNVCTYYKIPTKISSKQLEPYPIGEKCNYALINIAKTGELLVSGKSLMLGYWNDSVKTNKVFLKDQNKTIWYKTGDKVCLNKNNRLVYIGRLDRMVKRNGFRIELGEIESIILNNKNILHAAVVSNRSNNYENVITVHLVFKRNKKLTEIDLYDYCQKSLPKYMIPNMFKFHDRLPMTSTNKIDYNKLSLLYDEF